MKRSVLALASAAHFGCVLGIVLAIWLPSAVIAAEPASEVLQSTSDRMMALFRAGRYEDAARAADLFIAALEKAHGKGSNETAFGYAYQAKCHFMSGTTTQARAARDAAVAILSSTESRDPGHTALILFGLAVVSEDLEDTGIATQLAIDAATLSQRNDTTVPPDLGDFLLDLADAASKQGRPWQSDQLYELCLWATTKAHGEDSTERLERLEEVGVHYESQGRFAEAAGKHQEALAILQETLGIGSPVTAKGMLPLARCSELLGDYAKAESLAQQAWATLAAASGQKDLQAGHAAALVARSSAQQGKWEQADRAAREALDIVTKADGAKPSDLTEAYLTLMLVHELQGHFDEAIKVMRASLAHIDNSDESQSSERMSRLTSLAFALWSAGKHDEADTVFRDAIATCIANFGADSSLGTFVGANQAANHFYLGRYEEAEKLLIEAFQTQRHLKGDDDFRVAMLSVNLATVQAAQGKWRLAAEQNDLGLEGIVRQIRSQLASLPPLEQLRMLRGQYAIGYQAALTMGLLQRSDPRIRKLSAGWLANGKAIAHEASALRNTLEKRHSGNPGTSTPLPTIGEAYPWITIEAIREHVPRNAVLIDIARFDVFNYAAKRKGEDWQPARYAAWIVPPPGVGTIEVIDLGEAKPIDAAVAKYRDAIREALGREGTIAKVGEAAAENALRELAQPLTEQILKPILAGVKAAGCDETAKELIVSPDGELWLVPWAAIPMPDGHYLVEKRALSTVISSRDLVRSRGGQPAPSAPMIVADPIFDLPIDSLKKAITIMDTERPMGVKGETNAIVASASRSRSVTELGDAERLPGTAIEAALVAERLERLTTEKPIAFLQQRAIEERVKRMKAPRILHFGTHGFALPDQVASTARVERLSALSSGGRYVQGLTSEAGEPLEDPLLRCGLLLTGCNTVATNRPEGIEDGCLTGKEILSLDLDGTELVVLSACDTGLGRVQYGEGVAGLRQAFLIAGAESVLASLWQVPDEPTVDLVTGFFDHLDSGKGKAGALRQAQLDLIQRRRKTKGAAHPATWGAFEVTGR